MLECLSGIAQPAQLRRNGRRSRQRRLRGPARRRFSAARLPARTAWPAASGLRSASICISAIPALSPKRLVAASTRALAEVAARRSARLGRRYRWKILQRLNRASFEIAYAVQHTTGRGLS